MALTFPSCNLRLTARNKFSDSYALSSRFYAAKTEEEQPVIPNPQIYKLLDAQPPPVTEFKALPNIAQCAVHLQLLEAFLILKQKILNSNALDRTFRIKPVDKLGTRGRKRTRVPDPTFTGRRAVKWRIFIRLAASRFLRWWEQLEKILELNRVSHLDRRLRVTVQTLPPLGMSILNIYLLDRDVLT